MNGKNLFIFLCILMAVISVGCVSAVEDADVINATDIQDSGTEDAVLKDIDEVGAKPVDDEILSASDEDELEVGEPDFTDLQDLIDNSGNEIALDHDYVYSDRDEGQFFDRIIIDKDLRINGNGHTIDAKGKSGVFDLFFDDISVTLHNLTIKNSNSFALSLDFSDYDFNVNMTDVNFTQNTGDAVFYANCRSVNVTADNVKFYSNNMLNSEGTVFKIKTTAGASLACDGIEFVNNTADCGILSVSATNINISSGDVIFKNNTVFNGDGITGGFIFYVSSKEILNLSSGDVYFNDNNASYDLIKILGQGTGSYFNISCMNIDFVNNTAERIVDISEISELNLICGDVNFTDNVATGYIVNIWDISDSMKVNLNCGNINFVNNTAAFNGGTSIINLNVQRLNVTSGDVIFTDNDANDAVVYIAANNNGVVNVTSGRVKFKGNTAIGNGYVVRIESAAGVVILNCSETDFVNNTAYSVVNIVDVSVVNITCSGVNFTDNDVVSYPISGFPGLVVCIEDCNDVDVTCDGSIDFVNNAADGILVYMYGVGGVNIACSGVNFTDNNVTFNQSSGFSDLGYVVYIEYNNVDVDCSVSDFADNIATYGIVYMKGDVVNVTSGNINFTDNNATDKVMNIHGSSVNLTYMKGYFNNNTAKKGIVHINGTNCSVILNDIQFIANTVLEGNGGAVTLLMYGNNPNWVSITGSTFNNNTASEGGAVYIYSNHTDSELYLNITGSTFENNTAASGGAVYIWADDLILRCEDTDFFKNTLFYSSILHRDGGALYVNATATNALFRNATFAYNGASDLSMAASLWLHGGAIGFMSLHGSPNCINFTNSRFMNNTGYYGGGISLYGLKITDMYFNNTNFTGNAAYAGGAMCLEALVKFNMYLTGVNLEDNYAAGGSGALAIYADSNIISDLYVRTVNTTFKNNHAYSCGAMSVVSASPSCNFTLNCTNTEFRDNKADNTVGALEIQGGTGNIINATFINNTAAGHAGALNNWGVMTLTDSRFVNNTADVGSAIYNWENLTVIRTSFEGNTAVNGTVCNWFEYGCAVMTLKDSSFANNTAVNGGAVYNVQNMTVMGTSFANNTAERGGAIYNSGNMTITDSSLLENKANSTELTVVNATNTLNITLTGEENYLNAIYSENDNVTFNNVTYWNGNITNTDDAPDTTYANESGQNITVEVYKGNILKSVSQLSAADGHLFLDFSGYRLESGEYNYRAYHPDDAYYTYAEKTGKFTIFTPKTNTTLTVSVENVAYGENATVKVTLKDVDGNNLTSVSVNVTVDGHDYVIDIVNGVGSRNVTGLAVKDNYLANATFNGNVSYAPANATDYFNVTKAISLIEIYEINNATYGGAVRVMFNATNATNVTYAVKKRDGTPVGSETVVSNLNATDNVISLNLDAGDYNITITGAGNENYTGDVKSASFTVFKGNLAVDVVAENITHFDNGKVNITSIPSDFKGNVSIVVDGVTVYNGTPAGSIDIGRFAVGQKTAKVTFYGDANYEVKSVDANFTVSLFIINGTYTDLQNRIDNEAGTSLELPYDFAYLPGYDDVNNPNFINGVMLNKTMTIKGNGHTISGNGSARIFNVTCQAMISNIRFVNGSAADGAAIYIADSIVQIGNCTFYNNSASNEGGAVFVDVTHSSVLAIYVHFASVFENNTAGGNGGAVAIHVNNANSFDFDVKSAIFINNTAGGNGGAVSISSNNVSTTEFSMTTVKFINNTAGGNGGALFVNSTNASDDMEFNIQGPLFEDNAAGLNGGAIAIQKDLGKSLLILAGPELYNNAAGADGGALYYNSTGDSKLTLRNANFLKNTAFRGGAMSLENIWGTVNSVELLGNRANSTDLTYVHENDQLTVTFSGNENYLNAIYAKGCDNLDFEEDVVYWNGTAVRTTGSEQFNASVNESGIDIVLEIDNSGTLINLTTDKFGQIHFSTLGLSYGIHTFRAFHAEDDYYTFIERTGQFMVSTVVGTNLTVSVENIEYGQNATVNVTLTDANGNNLTGVDVNVTIDGKIYIIHIENGKGSINNVSGLAARVNYLANATFAGNLSCAASNAVDYFNVTKANSLIEIYEINNATYGGAVRVMFNATNATNVTYAVKKRDGTLIIPETAVSNVNATDNVIVLTLDAGDYTITITGEGNENYTGDVKSANFTVNKAASSIVIAPIGNVTYPASTVINFTVFNASDVNWTIVNKDTGDKITGSGLKNITEALAAGNYTVTIQTKGNDNVTGFVTSSDFSVDKAASSIVIAPIGNVTYPDATVINFTVSNATVVNWTIVNKDTKESINGSGLDNITRALAAGNYSVTIENANTVNVTGFVVSADFTVNKAVSSIVISPIGNVTYPDATVINFTVVNATVVNWTIVNKDTKESINGSGLDNITRALAAGNYSVTIENANTVNVTGFVTSADFTINKAVSSIVISPIGNVTYPDATVINFTVVNATVVNWTIVNKDTKEVINGSGLDNIARALAAGNYSVTIENDNTVNVTGFVTSADFTVDKAASSVVIDSVGNVTYPDATVVNFTVVNATVVNWAIVNKDTKESINGSGLDNITRALAAGNYTVTIENANTVNVTGFVTSADFTVNKAVSSIVISPIGNVTYPDATVINFTVVNATVVNWTIVNKDTKESINGSGLDNITRALAAGNYTITIENDNTINVTGSVASADFTVDKATSSVSAGYVNATYGDPIIVHVESENAINVTYEILDESGKAVANGTLAPGENITGLKLNVGNYTVNLATVVDANHIEASYVSNITVNKISDYEMNVSSDSPHTGDNATVTVNVPENATGNVTVTLSNGTNYTGEIKDGVATVNVSNLPAGDNNVTVTYPGDVKYAGITSNAIIHVQGIVIDAKDMKRGWDSPYDYLAKVKYEDGTPVVNKTVVFAIDGKEYKATTDDKGVAKLTDLKLDVGTYNVTVIFKDTGDNVTHKLKIVKRIVENKDLTMDYKDGHKFIVRAIGDDGNPVGKDVVVSIKINGKTYNVKTDEKGYAKLAINLIPKKYTATSTYHNYAVKNTVTVKQILKIKKTVAVKKGKNIVLKATLKKSNGKPIKGKTIKFRFYGKIFKVKTNSKGIAKATVKDKKVLKKLKKGKKYNYSASYVKDIVKGKVKIKK